MVWKRPGAVCWRMETSLKVASGDCRTHGTQSVDVMCRFETSVASRFTPHCRLVQGDVIYQMIRSQFVEVLTHIVANRGAGEQYYGWLVEPFTPLFHAPWDSVSPLEFLTSPVCTITAVSKDLVRRPTRISVMSLVLGHLIARTWGVFSRTSGTITPGSFTRTQYMRGRT